MTADSTTRLREALAEVLDEHTFAKYDSADAILASLVEHRDDVLDVLGMQQVGWHSERYGLYGRHADPAVLRRVSAVRPVYAFRPKEQP